MDWLVLAIPVISAIVGWGTNVIAVKMMFYPIEFIGIPPWLGWQGIVPANARPFAGKATELITSRLIDLPGALASFDPAEFTKGNLGASLDAMTDELIENFAATMPEGAWDKVHDAAKQQITGMIRDEVGRVAAAVLGEVSADIDTFIDVKTIVMDAAEKDRALIGEMFQQIGVKEFDFIRRSGAYFGMLFGIFQMGAWLFYPAWWVLPFFGFMVGYVTNWLAIKLIFEPAQPKKIGLWTVQGLFHKRQAEVSKEFASLVSGEIVNPTNMVAHMTAGKAGEKLFAIVDRHASELIERYSTHPMMSVLLPAEGWKKLAREMPAKLRDRIASESGMLHTFVSRSIDVYGELFERMSVLDSEAFESVLRPSFQKDEWKLILAGGALGLGAGVLQVVYLFGNSLG